MKKNLAVIIVCAVIFARCGEVNISTANFAEAKMCASMKDDECVTDNPVFSSSDPSINASVNLHNAPHDCKVTFSWFYVDSTRTLIGAFDSDLSEVESMNSVYSLHCSINRPEGGWPVGKYEVEMKIHTDNSKPLIKSFTVK